MRAALIAALACAFMAGCYSPISWRHENGPVTQRAQKRDPAQRAAFMAANPCPATGRGSGACPGFEVDHIWAICAGGADHPSNMQWLSIDLHKIKTRSDAAACRRGVPPPVAD